MFVGGAGSDTFDGGSGQDNVDYSASSSGVTVNYATGSLSGGDAANDKNAGGMDGAIGSNYADSLTGFDDMSASGSDQYTNQFWGNGGNDTISGLGGNDLLYGGNDQDLVYGGTGDDLIGGDAGQDTLYGDSGNDTIDGGSGNDTIFGGDDEDRLSGNTGDDQIDGGAGNDTLEGGDGNDNLAGGAGVDQLFGGNDADTFNAATGTSAGDHIDGGEGGTDFDTLNLTGIGPYRITYSATNHENGRVDFLDSHGNITGSMTFVNIEKVVTCFTPGTTIATARGDVAVERLRQDDRVITRDNGMQPICWVGQRALGAADFLANPQFRPILIRRGALGPGLPERDMMVSPNHRVLIVNDRNTLFFGEREVLVAAKHLLGRDGITVCDVPRVTYLHFMFDCHQVVLSNNAWTESFQPGDYTLSGMDAAQRAEIMTLFPTLETPGGLRDFASARRSLSRHEALLIGS